MSDDFDMGHVAEGILCYEQGGYWIKSEKDGKVVSWDVGEALAKYEGKEVRLVLVTFDTINKVAKLVAEGGLQIEDAMVGKSR